MATFNPAKPELRRTWLAQRRSLSPIDHAAKSQALCQQLQRHPGLKTPGAVVLSYFSIRQEPDLSPLMEQMPHLRWGFPRLEGEALHWHEWQLGQPLNSGPFNIPEPPRANPILAADCVTLMLVPCVGADRQGFRLGYGGGYYDRLLADPSWQTTVTIGIVFKEFVVDRLPTESWDRPLLWICSDHGLSRIAGGFSSRP
jgi:5-formyltetrahydrofolate cyclo-ligase